MKSVSMESFCYKNQVNVEFLHTCNFIVVLLYFSLESRLISAVLELGKIIFFRKLIRSRVWQLSHSCQIFDLIHAISYNKHTTIV